MNFLIIIFRESRNKNEFFEVDGGMCQVVTSLSIKAFPESDVEFAGKALSASSYRIDCELLIN